MTFMDKTDAFELAAKLNADDAEWTYRVRALKNGKAVVDVLDEDGHKAGTL